jgi:putative chitinase
LPFDPQRIARLCPRVKPEIAAQLAAALTTHAAAYDLTTLLRQAHFMGQMAHETGGFTRFEENLNYSAERIPQVFKSLASRAAELAHKPEALGNAAYANRLGNGNEASGDGWRFHGRGLVQITGRANYADMGKRIGVDLIAAPENAAAMADAVLVALAFWKDRGCNAKADQDDCKGVTRIINGPALAGLDDRQALTQRAKTIFA